VPGLSPDHGVSTLAFLGQRACEHGDGLRSPASGRWEMRSAPRTPVTLVTPSPRESASLTRGDGMVTPSMSVWRAASPPVGVVGQFIRIAPHLLLDGRSSEIDGQAHGLADWWADGVDAEFCTPALARTRPRTPSPGAALEPALCEAAAQMGPDSPNVCRHKTRTPKTTVGTGEEVPGVHAAPPSVPGFIDSLRLPLQESLLPYTSIRRVSHRASPPLVPRRSVRIAALSHRRDPKPEIQAKKVLLKKRRPAAEPPSPDMPDNSYNEEFHKEFGEPLSSSKHRSIRSTMKELFPERRRRGSPAADA
jgi:hypothetical protein